MREVHEHVKESSIVLQQHNLERSAEEQEMISLMKLLLLPQVLSLKGYTDGVKRAGNKRSEPQSTYRSGAYTMKWSQHIKYHFMIFGLLIRTGRIRIYDKQQKKLRQASHVLFDFKPFPLLEVVLNTAITVDIRWGNTLNGIWICPRLYTQVPKSHHLVEAAKTGDVLLLRSLICTDFVSPFCRTTDGWTLLHVSNKRNIETGT